MPDQEKKFKALERGKYGAKRTKEKHPSFGQLGFFRSQGGSVNLYGSSIKHDNRITLEISHSEKHRDYNENWYYPREEIIKISMSQTQFAEAISTMGSTPIPVTIERLNGKSMPPCPAENTRRRFKEEFKRDMEEVLGDMEHDFSEANEMLNRKGPLKAAERRSISKILDRVKMVIKSNIPFIHSQFDRATERTVAEARGEIEAFYENKIRSLGLEAARNKGMLPDQAPDLCLDDPKLVRTPVIDVEKGEDNDQNV